MKKFLRFLLNVAIVIILVIVICVIALFAYANNFKDDAFIDDIDNLTMNLATVIYAYDDNVGDYVEIERLHSGENRIWVDYEEIPQDLVDAFVAIEDKRFWKHHGVDWKRTMGAVMGFISGNDNYGGSTITQQFVKNITGDNSHKPSRKIREIVRATQLENRLEKEQIMELYLNTLYVGQNYYGVQAASQGYFGKDVSELTLAECASIAGITNKPTKYNPFLNYDNNVERQRIILSEMLDQGMITRDEYDAALAEPLVLNAGTQQTTESSYQSYYVDQVIATVLEDLQEQKGYSRAAATNLLYSGGLKIYCMMDFNVQAAVDAVFSDTSNFPTLEGEVQPEAAIAIIDPTNGDVVAMYGGRGPKTADRVLNRAVQTTRSPGSSIKPIAVYAPAVESGAITEATVIDDTPLYEEYPKNYYDHYKGLVTVKYAVEQSVNTVPIKIVNQIGAETSWNFLRNNLHVSSIVEADKDLAPMALGGLTNGISVLELAAAYVPFDNDGIYNKPRIYSQVVDGKDNVILDCPKESSVAMSSETAFIMNDMLQSVVQAGTGAGAKLKGGAQPAAGKTGTTDDDFDRWFVGYTPYYVGAVWFGYDQPKSVSGVSSNPALQLWRKVMENVHANLEVKYFPADNPKVVTESYCKDSGMLPGPYCKLDYRGGRVSTALYIDGTQPTETCNVHYPVTMDKATHQIATPYCPKGNLITVALLNVSRASNVTTLDSPYVVRVGSGGRIVYGSSGLSSLCTRHGYHAPSPSTTEPEPEEEAPAAESVPEETVPDTTEYVD